MSGQAVLDVEGPSGPRSIRVAEELLGKPLSELMRREGVPLNTRCGRRRLCQGCVVELVEGSLTHFDTGQTVNANGDAVALRGCEYSISAGASAKIRIPERSALAYEGQVVSEFRTCVSQAHDPLWVADLGSKVEAPIGVAIDVGTTTVVVVLVDLQNGQVIATASGFNRQMHFGDDVLTRIHLCLNDKSQVQTLRDAVVKETVQPLLAMALTEAARSRADVVCVTVAGNTTMTHLWAGIDPSPMGMAPFTPEFLEHRVTQADGLELSADNAAIHLLPGADAFLGSDVMAGVYASGMMYQEETSLLVDIGTNGEIILMHQGQLLGCSTAAGPAFEGARLECGVRAGRGAIAHIDLGDDPTTPTAEVIENEKPIGLCGTAYIDFLAEARRMGLLNQRGRFTKGIADARLELREGHGLAYTVATGRGGEPMIVSEADIASLLQAKAAIAGGVLCLLEGVGLKPCDVAKVYLAGGFGLHLNIANALGCGLLPGFELDRVEAIGNSSLAGAYLALVDRGALNEISQAGASVKVIELNNDPYFEECFIDQLSLP